MVIVSIQQPLLHPWWPWFDKARQSDVHVLLDNVQFVPRSYQQRNTIKTPQGIKWLTVPVQRTARDTLINEVMLAGDFWTEKHIETIRRCYCRAPYFTDAWPLVVDIYRDVSVLLLDFMFRQACLWLEYFCIDTHLNISSSYVPNNLHGSDLILGICKEIKATKYLTGPAAKNYLDLGSFSRAGIEVVWHQWYHPVYKQQWGEFQPGLSAIDYAMNCGGKL